MAAQSSSSWSEEKGEEIDREGGPLPLCKFGEECYRKNPQHFKEFAHPWLDDAGPPSEKRQKLGDWGEASGSRDDPVTLSPDPQISPDSPFTLSPNSLFYLTTVRRLEPRHNSQDIAIGIRDLLSPLMGDLICSAQFNYLIDIPWLLQQYPPHKRNCPLLIVHGDQKDANIRKAAAPYPNITLFKARLEIMFGTHHSKMMLLGYREGMRVVIHTANLILKDWDQKTQGVWVSPLFPRKNSAATQSKSDTVGTSTGFKQDLLEYLKAYGGRGLEEWKQRINDHDLSAARVHLIASVPGAHTGGEMSKWGHLKLRKVLSTNARLPRGTTPSNWPVIGQFSSVGSLGPAPSQWLATEWLTSLSSLSSSSSASSSSSSCSSSSEKKLRTLTSPQKMPPLKLIFPSVENVRTSLEGYMAGGSIPYAAETAAKQPYLRNFLHQWKAEGTGRTRAAPHIKTYMRVSPDEREVSWILITSSNLSKAAWGALEKKGSQLKIRSYEIGVLFFPSDQDASDDGGHTTFSATTRTHPHATSSSSEPGMGMGLVTPFDLPLTPYTKEDQPWVWNTRHMKPDSKGNVWTPP